ncbi:WD40 repeat domain-containing protein [Kitasatospora sp. NPDC087314]|uniref:WD40 repeat domain-containing protein n=1 Tax=Kitasatospora sp. NPDC087314 TaxID=3364068 RepID=UPI0037FB82BA
MRPTSDLSTALVADANTPLSTALIGHTSGVASLARSPDGHTLASSGLDGTTRLWGLTDPGHPAPLGRPLTGHSGAVETVAISSNGHTLASAGVDGTLRLWEMNTDRAIQQICTNTRNILTRQVWQRYIPGLPFNPPCG